MYEDERRGRWWCYRGTFPSTAWLHPHAATAAVEAHNLATVARYNRYCGRGLNGGELAQVKPPHRHDNPRLVERPLATVHSPSFLTPPNPYASFFIPIHLPLSFLLFPHSIEPHHLPFPLASLRLSFVVCRIPTFYPFDCLRLYGVAHACAAVFVRLCVGCECRAAARWRSCAPAPVYVRACNYSHHVIHALPLPLVSSS